MTDWTAGYVADVGYTYGYYPELNPQRIKLAFLNAGVKFPEVANACELGFGQGVSINAHGAASVTRWYGTDFNPAQAGFAQELAKAATSDVKLYDEAFAEFCSRPDLPDFDYIGLHGIWSWISDENRAVIVEFVRRKLRVGGVLYISYNTQPGWAPMVPMRDLLTEHAATLGAEGVGIVNRIDSALAFAEKLMATDPFYAKVNPQIAERLKALKGQNRSYLAHEYFNRDWFPMSFSRMADWLSQAKLTFACSAHYMDHVDALNLKPEQQKLINEIPDLMFRQTVRDFCVNQQFRRDYWVRGARRLNNVEQAEALRAQRVVLVQHREEVSLKVSVNQGVVTMQESIYGPILDALAKHVPMTLGEIEQAIKGKVSFPQILQAVLVLTATGALVSAQDDDATAQVRPTTERFNAYVLDKARGSEDISYLASPLTGGGVTTGRIHQLFLLAIAEGKDTPALWADFVWQLLGGQGLRLLKDGKPLETPEENKAQLITEAREFAEKRLPILRSLQIL